MMVYLSAMEDLKKVLIQADKARVKVRKDYSADMRQRAAAAGALPGASSTIYFPPIHLSPKNGQLAKGTPWFFNGFVISTASGVMVVDPGVHFLYRLTESDFDLATIKRMFLSHAHLDHTSDANAIMDWLIRARAKVDVFAPPSLFSEQRISNYHSGIGNPSAPHKAAEVNPTLVIKDEYTSLSFFRLEHDAECYGFRIYDGKKTIAYISDTSYAKTVRVDGKVIPVTELTEQTEAEIVTAYDHIRASVKDSDTLIVNIDSFLHGPKAAIHFSITDLLAVVADTHIRKIFLAHMNPAGELTPEEWGDKIAAFVQAETGIPTYCPGLDGLLEDL